MLVNDGRLVVSKEEFRKDYVRMIRVISLVGFLYFPILYLGFHNFTSDSNAAWFQRCGALIVFISVVIQFLVLNLNRMVNDTLIDFGDGNLRTEMEDFRLRRKGKTQWRSEPTFSMLHELVIFIFGSVGTVIWGYGDLIYKWF